MTGYTPIYNLPYPQASDLVSAYPGTGQDLAEEVETVLAAKAPTASPTFTGNVVWSGATLRTAVADVSTGQTTTSTSYTDLATVGPSVTLTTGTKALVVISAAMYNNTAGNTNYVSVAGSGATTFSAAESFGLALSDNAWMQASRTYLVTGLTAGSNTFTLKYKTNGGTASFVYRSVAVIDLGS